MENEGGTPEWNRFGKDPQNRKPAENSRLRGEKRIPHADAAVLQKKKFFNAE